MIDVSEQENHQIITLTPTLLFAIGAKGHEAKLFEQMYGDDQNLRCQLYFKVIASFPKVKIKNEHQSNE